MDPLTHGDYPHSMQSLVGNRLPKFNQKQSKLVKGSFDFIGLNYYTANYAANATHHNSGNASWSTDSWANLSSKLIILHFEPILRNNVRGIYCTQN